MNTKYPVIKPSQMGFFQLLKREVKKTDGRVYGVKPICGFPLRRAWAQRGGGDGEQRAVCVQAAAEKRQQERRMRGEERTKTSLPHKKSTSDRFLSNNPLLTCTLINVST